MDRTPGKREEADFDDAAQDAWDEAWSEGVTPTAAGGETGDDVAAAPPPQVAEEPPSEAISATHAHKEDSADVAAPTPAVVTEEPPVLLETLPNTGHTQGSAKTPSVGERSSSPLKSEVAGQSTPESRAHASRATAAGEAQATPPPNTFAAAYASAEEPAKFPTRLVTVGILGAGVLGVSTWVFCTTDWFTAAPRWAPPSVETLLSSVTPNDRDAWLRDVLAAKRDAAQDWDPVATQLMRDAARPRQADVPERVSQHQATKAGKAAPMQRSVATVQPVDDFYGNIFGSAERYETASSHPAARGTARTSTGAAKAPNVKGAVVDARLEDVVASDAPGAPVIAAVRRKVQVGNLVLLPGMELHGRVSGSSDTRVFVAFEFVRTPEGDQFSMLGSARDQEGRTGIPGVRQLTRATAGSVGVASASSGIAALGRSLASDVGEAFGAAIEAAGNASAEKAKRVDRDEYVVVVSKGTHFAVCIDSVELAGS